MFRAKDIFKKVTSLVVCELLIMWQMDMALWTNPAYAANEQFVQTDWTGGTSSNVAVHPTNKTGWNKYEAKSSTTDASQAGKITLSTASGSVSETTAAHFNAGTKTNVTVTTVSGGEVKLNGVTNDQLRTTLGQWSGVEPVPYPVGYGASACYVGTVGLENYIYVLRGNESRVFMRYNVSTKEWATLKPTPFTVNEGAALAYPVSGDFIYCLRGNNSKDFWKYSITNNTWTACANVYGTNDLVVGRGGSLVAFDSNTLYATRGNASINFWQYTISNNTWFQKANISPGTAGYGAKLCYPGTGDNIYLTLGENSSVFLMYNRISNTWASKTNVSSGATNYGVRYGSALVAGGDGYLYCAPGYDDNWRNLFLRYSITGNSWGDLDIPPFITGYGSCMARNSNNNKIYAMVGRGFNTIEMPAFDLTAQTWSMTLGVGTPDRGCVYVPTSNAIFALQTSDARYFYKLDIATGRWTKMTTPSFDNGNSSGLGQFVWTGAGSTYEDYIYWICTAGTQVKTMYRYKISTNAWETMAIISDAVTFGNAFLIYPGSGHDFIYLITTGNRSFFLKYQLSTNAWTRLTDTPAAMCCWVDGLSYPNPSTSTTIYMMRYNDSKIYSYNTATNLWNTTLASAPTTFYRTEPSGGAHQLMIYPGSGDYIYVNMGRAGTSALYKYSISGNTWSVWSTTNAYPGSGDCRLATYYPGAGDLIYIIDRWSNFYKYSISAGTYTALARPAISTCSTLFMTSPTADKIYYRYGSNYPLLLTYTISTNTWTVPFYDVNSQSYGFGNSSRAVRVGDYVYAIMGASSKSFYRYSIADNSWSILAATPGSMMDGSYLMYPGTGDLLYAVRGGATDFWKYSITNNTWTALAPVTLSVGYGCSMVYNPTDSAIYLLRGGNTATMYRYIVSNNTWFSQPNAPIAAREGSDMVYSSVNDKIYGLFVVSIADAFYEFDYSSGIWTKKTSYPVQNSGRPFLLYTGGNDIYALNNAQTPYFYKYSISGNAWTTLANAPARMGDRGQLVWGGPNYPDLMIAWRGTDTWIYGWEGFKYSISENQWDSPPYDPNVLHYRVWNCCVGGTGNMAPVYLNGKHYLYMAAKDANNINNTTMLARYCIEDKAWAKLAGPPERINVARGGHLAYPGTGDYIYGIVGEGTLSLYRYSISNNAWDRLADAPAALDYGADVAYGGDGYLYVLRGANTNVFYRYNISTNAWQARGSVPANVYTGGSLVYVAKNDSLYCFSGYSTAGFYRFNRATQAWATNPTPIPALVDTGGNLAYPGIGDYIYACAGNSTRKFLRYSITNDTWQELDPLPNYNHGYGKLVYGGDGYFYLTEAYSYNIPYIRKYNVFASGEYTSQVIEAGQNAAFDTATWTDTADGLTTLANVKIRSSNSSTMAGAPDFKDYATKGADISTLSTVTDKNKYLQYKVELKTTDLASLPEFRDITMNYSYYPASATLTSSVYDATTLRDRIMKLSWTETLPAGTDARFQVRTSADNTTWSNWLGPTGTTSVTNDFSTEADYSKSSHVKLESGYAKIAKDLQDFAYKQAVTVDNTGYGAGTNVVVKLSLGSMNAAFWSHIQSDGDDIRFYDPATSQKLSYRLTSIDYTNKTASINVKIPSLAAGEVKTIYILYGSSNAVSESDITVAGVPMSGLVGWWQFDEGSGGTAADNSGQNNIGTLVNNPTWVSGKFGSALQFNGSNQYVNVGGGASLKLNLPLTFSMWIKLPTSPDGNWRQLISSTAWGGNPGYDTMMNSNQQFIMTVNGSECTSPRTNWGITVDTWHLITYTVTSTTSKLYIDATLKQTWSGSWALSASSYNTWLGYSPASSYNYFMGSMDDVLVYNRALSDLEITDIYTGTGGFQGSVYIPVPEEATTSPTLGANWPYREAVTAANSGATALTNYQMRIALDKTHTGFWSHVKNDGSDIRFIDSDNTTAISYWLESFDYANKTAAVHIKIPSISASSSKSIYLYYGNAAATTTSDPNALNIPMTGLVGWWRFDEGSGSTAADNLGADNTGILTSLYSSPAALPVWRDGRFGKALTFNAANEAVSIEDAANLQPANECTISAWIKPYTSTGTVFGREYSTVGDDSYVVWYSAANTISHFTQAATAISNATFIPADTWYHIAAVKRGANIYIYKNGTQVATGAAPATITYTAGKKVFIGADDNDNNNAPDGSFNGIIDNVLFYNRGLLDAEITKLYNEPTYSVAATQNFSYTETANTYLFTTYYTDNPVIQPIYGIQYNNDLAEFQEVATKPAGTEVKYQVSKDMYNWYWYNGSAWAKVAGGYSEANTAAVINTNLATFMSQVGTTGEFFYRAYLHNDNSSVTPSLDQINMVAASSTSYYLSNTGAAGINSLHTDATSERYFQYKATLYSSGENAPTMDDITMEYINAYLTITSPVGGELWIIGGPSHNITWDTGGLTNVTGASLDENVKIEYTADGTTWKTVAASTPNSGTYPWTIPDDHTPIAKVRITSLGWPVITTQSPATFRIGGTITLTKPTGGERMIISTATADNITWTSAGNMPNVKIEYSRNGSTWSPVLESEGTANDGIVANDGKFTWTIPDEATTTNSCLIRVSDSADSATVSTLATPFRIIGEFSITYPTVGVDLVSLQSYNVTWTTKGLTSIPSIKMSYSTDGGTTWKSMAGAAGQDTTVSNPASPGSYSWNVPNPLTTNAVVKVTDPNDSTVYNISPVFNVRGFQITSPNGAEEWELNATHDITWSSAGTLSTPIMIYLSTDGGSTYTYWLKQFSTNPGSPATWSWQVTGVDKVGANYTASNTCKIKIVDNTGRFDISDANFRIMANPVITVNTPVMQDEWKIGTGSHDITWTNTGNISTSLTIEYSKDGGVTWTAVSPAPTTAEITAKSYSWTIPDVGGALPVNTQVRVRESTAPVGRDTQTLVSGASATFKIISPTLAVTAPTLGTIWVAGDTSRLITWTSEGTLIDNLKLDYSKDGGTTWTNIDAFTQAQHNGNDAWTNIPLAAAGPSVLIRISDSRTPANVYAISDAIQILPHERITLTKPATGEFVVQGDTYNVTWTWDGQKTNNNLTLRLSVDGGTTWPGVAPYLIEVQIPNSPTTFAWSVPSTLESTNAILRIYDPADPVDVSSYTGVFTITLPVINVTAPAAGNNWYATGTYDITWSTIGSVSNSLKIEYSLNGGAWQLITAATTVGEATAKAKSWTLPDAAGSTCQVRITDNGRPAIIGASAAFNIIAPTVSVTVPDGSEAGANAWVVGTPHDISWVTVGGSKSAIGSLNIKYTTDGTTFNNITTITDPAILQADAGSYTWTIPDAVSTTARIKITDLNRTATTVTSNAFEIAPPSVVVTSPDLGTENWIIGTQHNITWYSIGAVVEPFKLYYTPDGTTWKNISLTELNDGIYAWTIPDDYAPGTAKVKLSDSYATPRTDTSDRSFTIGLPTIAVDTPTVWSAGDTKAITWVTTGTLIGPLKVEWSTDNFASTHILSSTVDKAATSYNWAILPEAVSTNVRTKVTDLGRTQSWGKTAAFTVLPSPVITITAPTAANTGVDSWRIGKAYAITWTDNGGAISNDLKLQYSVNGGTAWTDIATGVANTGTYNWTVPVGASATTAAKVRIYDNTPWKAGTNLTSDSAVFEIAIPRITITNPVDTTYWAIGDRPTIAWTTDGFINDNLAIQYSDDGGTSWYPITSGLANGGSYQWTVPDAVSVTSNMKIKIIDASSNYGGVQVVGTSAAFNIIAIPTITIGAPNGGEIYVLGDDVTVTWTWKGLSISNNILIEASNDNFVNSRQVVATGLPNSGAYTWTLTGATMTGSTLKIRISDGSRTTVTDMSNGYFRIRGGLTLTKPNGGEIWGAKSPQNITWTANGNIPNIKLDYSQDNGATWQTIIASATNILSYTWTLPDVQTAQALVRVSDATDDSVTDTSNAIFSIVYFTVKFNVLDYDTLQHLNDFTVNEPGTGWNGTGQSSPLTRTLSYPYGTYSTFFTKSSYIDNSVTWSAPKEGNSVYTLTCYLENSASAQVTWESILSYSYGPADDVLNAVGSLQRKGKLVGTTELERSDMGAAVVTIYEPDGTTVRKSLTAITPNISGTYTFTYPATAFEAGKVYPATLSIEYRGRPYISSANIDVGAEILQYEFFTKTSKKLAESVASIESAVAGGTSQTRLDIEDSRKKLVGDIENTRQEIAGDITASSTVLKSHVTSVLSATEAALKTVVSEARTMTETAMKSQIINTESAIRSGSTLTVRYRTYSGLSPTIDVYNADNTLEVNKGVMTEITTTGVYEYDLKFEAAWGKGDFTIICSETTKGSLDALLITVISTDLEQVAGQVAGILGTTSSLSTLKASTEAMTSQFSVLETALSKMSKDLVSQVKDAAGSVSAFDSIFSQLKNMAKQIQEMSGESTVNLQKLYEVSAGKKDDMTYLKNKTQELKAAMEISQKLIENVANKPVTETWYEYK